VRVVQVWFQNQRAKMKKMQRRAKTDKDGKQIDKDGSKDKDGKSTYKDAQRTKTTIILTMVFELIQINVNVIKHLLLK
jgi:hypothetical protein